MGEKPLKVQIDEANDELLRNARVRLKLPDEDAENKRQALIAQLDDLQKSLAPTPNAPNAPTKPKKTREDLLKEFDENIGWAQLFSTSLVKGMTSPVSDLLTSDLRDKMDKSIAVAKQKVLQKKSTQKMSDILQQVAVGWGAGVDPTAPAIRMAVPFITPENVVETAAKGAEFTGAAISSIPYGTASSEFAGLSNISNLARPMNLTERALRQVASGTMAGTGMAAFAHLEPGESRAASVAKNALIAGATETLLVPLFLRSWKDELGVGASKKLTDQVSRALGVHPKAAEAGITTLRAGASEDNRLAEAVVKAAAADPEIKNSPIVVAAQKRLEATFGKLLPKDPPQGDRSLFYTDPNYGISMTVKVNGKPFPIQIRSNKNDLLAWQRGAQKLRSRLVELTEQGQDISLEDFKFHSQGTYERFKNFMFGVDRKGSITVKPEDLPGAAPKSTLAETGHIPSEGTPLKVVEDGKPDRIVTAQPNPDAKDPFTLQVKNGFGGLEDIPLNKARVDIAAMPEPLRFSPPPKGEERRFIVHNTSGDASFESVGAPKEENYFRSPFFEEIDSSADLGHDVRGYVHDDGSVTLSVPQVQRFFTLPRYATRVEDMGPQDSVAFRTRRPTSEVVARLGTNSFGGQTTFAERGSRLVRNEVRGPGDKTLGLPGQLKKVQLEYETPMSFGAGFVPRKLRDDKFAYPKWMGQMDKESNPLVQVERGSARERPEEIPLRKSSGITAQARTQGKGLTQVPTPQLPVGGLNGPKAFWIDPKMRDVPELITARDSARVLLKKGIDPETKVRIRTSEYSHGTNGLIDTPWTLRELSQVEPHMIPLDALRTEASYRGFKVIPDGRGVILRENETGAERMFDHQLEAAEFITRMPISPVGTRLEDAAEKTWRMGWYRSFDADVDASRYLGVDAQELATQELFSGQRPLIQVWSSDSTALGDTIREIEKARGLKPGTLRVQELDPHEVGFGAGKGMPYAIYDPVAVSKVHGVIKPGLDAMGVQAEDAGKLVAELAKLPRGLDALMGRDPESALVYSYLRRFKMKDEWELGALQRDTLGAFRTYDPQMKRALFARIQGASRDFEPMDESLEDLFPWDPEVRFDPDSNSEPPMMENIGEGMDEHPVAAPPEGSSKLAGGTYSDKPHFPGGLQQWFRNPMEMYKEWEAKTKVPFWTSWKVLQDAKLDTEAALAAPYKLLNSWKDQYSKNVREQAQLIFETRMAGKSVEDLAKAAKPGAVDAADQLEQAWRTFLGEMGYDDMEMRDFFSTFPQLRKKGGDYKAFVGGRSGLPKLMRMLNSDFMSGNIRITDREVDGFTIGRRVMRMVAQEKHLKGPWDSVKTKMEAYAKSEPGIPKDMFNHFAVGMGSIKHTPDDMAVNIQRWVNNTFDKMGISKKLNPDQIGDFVSLITGLNYNANMAWRLGLVLRNMMQTLQTTFPIAGPKYTGEAVAYGIRWLRDPKLQEEMIHRGVIPRDALAHSFSDIQDFVLRAEGGGKIQKGLVSFLQKGTAWYKTTDDFNRVVAYQAQYMRAMDEGKKFLEHRDWDRFVRRSKLDMQDARNGPLVSAARRFLVENGDMKTASHLIADNFQRMTQFQYARENAPRILQSTAGRLLGQYGTWSMAYAEYMKSMATRGSWENRAKALGSWVGMNAAMYYTANELFGVNSAKWLFFSPLSYTGGPLAQIGQQGLAAANMLAQGQVGDSASEADAVTRMQAGRLTQAWKQFVPGFGAARDVFRALDEEEFGEAMKRFLGMPSSTQQYTSFGGGQ